MDDLVTMLKTKEYVKTQQNVYKRLLKAHLIVIDNIMLFPRKKIWRWLSLTLLIKSMSLHQL
jgi:hypothetical protein